MAIPILSDHLRDDQKIGRLDTFPLYVVRKGPKGSKGSPGVDGVGIGLEGSKEQYVIKDNCIYDGITEEPLIYVCTDDAKCKDKCMKVPVDTGTKSSLWVRSDDGTTLSLTYSDFNGAAINAFVSSGLSASDSVSIERDLTCESLVTPRLNVNGKLSFNRLYLTPPSYSIFARQGVKLLSSLPCPCINNTNTCTLELSATSSGQLESVSMGDSYSYTLIKGYYIDSGGNSTIICGTTSSSVSSLVPSVKFSFIYMFIAYNKNNTNGTNE